MNDIIPQTAPASGALVEIEQQRSISEVQTAMIIAKRFPRDVTKARDAILQSCTRPGLAEAAMYSYSRGGTDITGPSIRLAEAMAQAYGNLDFGIRELSQKNGVSEVEAYAWDMETNTKQRKVFQVQHVRHTKAGSYKLEDPRDLYELVANNGARRLRACILGVIPGDIVDEAVRQCELTLKTKITITPELIKSLLEKFAEYKVTQAMIEKRIQRHMDAITPALVAQLGKIYNSMKDGMSTATQWFEADEPVTPIAGEEVPPPKTAAAKGMEALKAKIATKPQPPATERKADPLGEALSAIKKMDFDLAADLARGLSDQDREFINAEIKTAMGVES